MTVSPPFKMEQSQINRLADSADKIGLAKSKVGRAAMQIFIEMIENAKTQEDIDRIVAHVVGADKRAKGA